MVGIDDLFRESSELEHLSSDSQYLITKFRNTALKPDEQETLIDVLKKKWARLQYYSKKYPLSDFVQGNLLDVLEATRHLPEQIRKDIYDSRS